MEHDFQRVPRLRVLEKSFVHVVQSSTGVMGLSGLEKEVWNHNRLSWV